MELGNVADAAVRGRINFYAFIRSEGQNGKNTICLSADGHLNSCYVGDMIR